MTTVDDLKPCPFCGGKPFTNHIEPHEHGISFGGVPMPPHEGSYTIECFACGLGIIDATLDAVTATWNRRNPPEGGALEGEREKLLEKLVAAQDKLLVAYRLGASRSPGKAIDDIRKLKEKLAALQPPVPAIPQSGDEKEGTDG